jgi:hypothetical protein
MMDLAFYLKILGKPSVSMQQLEKIFMFLKAAVKQMSVNWH